MVRDDIAEALNRHADALLEVGLAAEVRPFESDVFKIPVIALSRRRPVEVDCATPLSGFIDDLPVGCLLSGRITSDDLSLRECFESAQFHLVECYLSMRHSLKDVRAPEMAVREAAGRDMHDLRELAGQSFRHSRWHCDSRIPKEAADESRARWVENAVSGRAEAVYVTDDDSGVCGFVCCMRKSIPKATVGVLDLIAVAQRSRGKGLGRSLVRQFLVHSRDLGRAFADVGTQAHNYDAVRLYEAEGFRLNTVQYTYHRHVRR